MTDSIKTSDKKLIVNPLFFSVPIIYGISRILEFITGTSEFWPKVWLSIVDFFGNDNFNVLFVGTVLYSVFFVYWFFGLILIFFDLTSKPKFIRKYKTQASTNEPVDREMLKKAIKGVLFNQIFISVPLSYIGYYINKSKGFPTSLTDVPTFTTIMKHLIFCILCDEIGFYYSHRLIHYPILYKWIHKQHHEWTSPVAITASYAHPIEHILSNILPIGLGPVLIKIHTSTVWIWHTIATLTTLNNHSGYHFPLCHSSEFHDFHHARFVECFGKLGLLDRLHKTDELFRKTINNSRHRVLFSLKSARERFPDVKKDDDVKNE